MNGTDVNLPGFVADQPLGFIAALGLLRALDRARPEWKARLGWKQYGYWRARLHLDRDDVSPDDVVDAAWRGLEQSKPEIAALAGSADKNLKLSRAEIRLLLRPSAAQPARKTLGCLVTELPEEDGVAARSSWQMLNGAGRTDFLPCLDGLVTRVTRQHVKNTLRSAAWAYADDARGGLTLRLDSSADRNHALLSDDPDNMPMTTELGAERLAMEALGLLPVHPGPASRTSGFHRSGRTTVFRWPVWEPLLNKEEVLILLTHPALANPGRHREALRLLGVAQVMEAQRVVVGKGKTFLGPTRAYPVA